MYTMFVVYITHTDIYIYIYIGPYLYIYPPFIYIARSIDVVYVLYAILRIILWPGEAARTYITLLHISWSNNEKTSSWVMFLDKNMQNEVSSYKYSKNAKPCLYSREKIIFIQSSMAKVTLWSLYEDFISYKLHM